jgi:Chitobiase/beta-hexosaminidase C-terminal domain
MRKTPLYFCCRISSAFALLLTASLPAFGQVNVLTYHNDFARTGQNTNETILTPSNVNMNTFGKIFSCPVDGQIYAQPLYVSNLAIQGQGTHNVVFVATMHNSVYAFDADSNGGPNGRVLWQVNLGPATATPDKAFGWRYGDYHDIRPEVGIIGTPVIDLVAGTIYLSAFTHEGTNYVQRIHALSITNGEERPLSPVVVSATINANGVSSVGGKLSFDHMNNGLQRPALTLAGGVLYVAYSGFADTDPYHGWLLGFDAATLQQLTNRIFNTTPNSTVAAWGPNAGEGGLWMGGNGPLVDAATNLYFEVGNGPFNADTNGTEYGDSFVKLSTTNGLAVADYFTPYNQASLAAGDTDLGSGGPVLLPDEVGSTNHPHLIVGSGKSGTIYLIDRDNMGHYNPANDSQIVQSVVSAIGACFATPAYFNKTIYYQGNGDRLKAFAITNGALSTTPIHRSSSTIGFPGSTPSVSANGTNNAIVWVVQNTAVNSGSPTGPAILYAYNAYNLTNKLYDSSQAGVRDTASWAVKTSVPTVANGKVYVGGASALTVYGNGTFLAVPTIAPAGGYFTNSVTVTLADATPGTTLYYTLDNSNPTTNSIVYTAPFVLTNTAAVKMFAAKPGMVPSAVYTATFINSASLVFSPGFVKQEFYSGATRANLEDPSYTTPPTLVKYLTSFETPSGQGNNYAERVSALFTAPQTTNYIFFLASDDDSDLFLSTDSNPANKRLIAQETMWSNSRQWFTSGGGSVLASKRSDTFAGTTWPTGNTISLTAGVQYYLEGVHHQGSGGDAFAATFKFAGAPDPANGSTPTLTGNLLGVNAFNNTYITLTSVPQDVALNPGANATFSVSAFSGYLGDPAGVPAPPISYQWQSLPFGAQLFANINGATSTSYTTPTLTGANDGSQYRAVLTTAGNFTNSPAARLRIGQLQFTQASINSGQFTLQWTGNGVLLESTNVTGPWTVSANQNNPQTVGVTGMKFYRLRQ